MRYTLEFHLALADEIEELKLFHEQKQRGLGDKFYAELLNRFELIIQSPLAFAVVERDVRVVRLRRFSYLVRYCVLDTRVRILSVIHGARAEGDWRFRR
jgi:hypothetical protein